MGSGSAQGFLLLKAAFFLGLESDPHASFSVLSLHLSAN